MVARDGTADRPEGGSVTTQLLPRPTLADHSPDEPERDSRRLASEIADHIVNHPEDLEEASLLLRMAVLEEQMKMLTVEVHQHWP